MKHVVAVGFALLTAACGDASREVEAFEAPSCDGAVSSIDDGFGADGPHEISVSRLRNPRDPALEVSEPTAVGSETFPGAKRIELRWPRLQRFR